MERQAIQAGKSPPTRRPLGKDLLVGGIGTGRNKATHEVTHYICVSGDCGVQESTFTAPELLASDVPAVWGSKSMRDIRCIIDEANDVLYMAGPGGYKITLSPGSRRFNLFRSDGGHPMRPCSEFH